MTAETGKRLLTWYAHKARPFIAAQSPADLAMLDADGLRLEAATRLLGEDVPVCFVGNSGVGKSTLLNALLSDRFSILPHGGIGPQTARPTLVRYAKEPYFRASYVGVKELNELRFLLEVAHQLDTKGTSAEPRVEADPEEVEEGILRVAQAVLGGDPPPEEEGATSKLEQAQKRARLLVRGSQDGSIDLPYLIDAVRRVLGQNLKFERSLEGADEARMELARECVALGKQGLPRTVPAGEDRAAFLEYLAKHASGSLAPLILELEVGWTSDLLSNGLVLVDLPGLGVSGDEFQEAASDWIGRKAKAVILVTDRSGLTHVSVEPLRKARFFNNLLHAEDTTNNDPVTMGMVMVRVDDVATAAWESELEVKGEDDVRPWGEIFEAKRNEGMALMRDHAEAELKRIVDDGLASTREERARIIESLRSSLEVHAISAPEYRRFLRKHAIHPAKVSAIEESGLPGLQRSLSAIAQTYQERRVAKATTALTTFEQHTRATINLVRAMWEQEARAEQEAQALAQELDSFLLGLRKELEVRRQRFANFLRETIPALIASAVAQAALDASPAVDRYLRGLSKLHWATLAATVRKEGKFESSKGKIINLPKELALRFEEPIAVAWSRKVLVDLRRRTAELGSDYAELTGEVVEWARARSARVQPRLVEALHVRIQAQTKSLAKVGKEAIEEMREEVRNTLATILEKQIGNACRKFIAKGANAGAGVKSRILDELMIGELAGATIQTAQKSAGDILIRSYRQAELDIENQLGELSDPLQSARDTLVQSHEDSVRRSDARKKKSVLAEAQAILDEIGCTSPDAEQSK